MGFLFQRQGASYYVDFSWIDECREYGLSSGFRFELATGV